MCKKKAESNEGKHLGKLIKKGPKIKDAYQI